MKKYKLIKEYPGSPKLNEIWNEDTLLQGLTFSSTQNEELQINQKISNFKEFWEEVIEKDYEILAYISKLKNCIVSPGDEWLDHGDWDIHSIKRLSDGEIFTVGDKITAGTIKRFFINGNSLICVGGKNMDMNISLHVLISYEKPLFTTKDGVDIFERDCNIEGKGKRLYQVPLEEGEDSWYDPFKPYALLILNDHSLRHYPSKSVIFSTKKAAEEYILMNKPCLSINDIKHLYKTDNRPIIKRAIKVVRNKLNL